MSKENVILVDIMQGIVSAMKVINPLDAPNLLTINYNPGRSSQIIDAIDNLDNSITMKGLAYPLFAMLMPVMEKRGSAFYADVKIDRIVLAVLSKTGEGSEFVMDKYSSAGTFKTILYPMYYEFFKQLARSKYTTIGDPDAFEHTKVDNPSAQPVSGERPNDFIDSIEILNLEFSLNQIKTC